MTIRSEIGVNDLKVKITITGHFDFNTHQDFRNAYKKANPHAAFIIDMTHTDLVDSSALGMLLLLREFAGGDKSDISIIGCNEDIMSVFEVSNFSKLFSFAGALGGS